MSLEQQEDATFRPFSGIGMKLGSPRSSRQSHDMQVDSQNAGTLSQLPDIPSAQPTQPQLPDITSVQPTQPEEQQQPSSSSQLQSPWPKATPHRLGAEPIDPRLKTELRDRLRDVCDVLTSWQISSTSDRFQTMVSDFQLALMCQLTRERPPTEEEVRSAETVFANIRVDFEVVDPKEGKVMVVVTRDNEAPPLRKRA